MKKELTQINDRLQDIGELLEDIGESIEVSLSIKHEPPQVTVNSPELSPVVNVAPATAAVTVEQNKPCCWKFAVTKRDVNGMIQEFTATPTK
jgi:hypothetical protein